MKMTPVCCVQVRSLAVCVDRSDLGGAGIGSSLTQSCQPKAVSGAPHLVSYEIVAQSIQATGDVGQTHGSL